MTDEFKWAILDLEEGLCNHYPSIYRMGGQVAAEATVNFWKSHLKGGVTPEELNWFVQAYLGRAMFESAPPKPHHLKLVVGRRGDGFFELGVRFDQMMQAYYMSLYSKDPGPRLERIEEYARIFEEEKVSFTGVDRLASRIKRSAAWRSYPPSMYDIRSLINRDKAGVDSFEAEFANYCMGNSTPCVNAVTRVIGKDNLRLMSLDAQERIFGKIYFSLDEKGWDKLRDARVVSAHLGEDDENEVASRENTLSVFNKRG